ncbi:putative kinesin-like protein KIF12 [Penaeus vannamei]|uniref:Putative kinesin-like protein KIF12 n=1 Tax=Penaeus vannamei TaxID=6689 RepID=A0A3R7MFT4_PENVA|nr:putative kinesin-like protein KIF12 [Penaeus vannamei]
MDPKEKVILSLQREVSLLREENAHLKMLLDLADVQEGNQGEGLPKLDRAKITNGLDTAAMVEEDGARMEPPPMPSRQGSFRVDKDKLTTLNNQELINLVQHYMAEHETVRKENKELEHDPPPPHAACHNSRGGSGLCRKGHLTSFVAVLAGVAGTSRSTPGTSRSTPGSRGRSVPDSKGSPRKGNRLPDSINKELERRRIGKSMNDLSAPGGSSGGRSTGGRRNSWDGEDTSGLPAVRRPPVKSKSMSPGLNSTKSGTRVKGRSQSVPRQKGRGKGSPGGPPKTSDRRPTGHSSRDLSPPSEVEMLTLSPRVRIPSSRVT